MGREVEMWWDTKNKLESRKGLKAEMGGSPRTNHWSEMVGSWKGVGGLQEI